MAENKTSLCNVCLKPSHIGIYFLTRIPRKVSKIIYSCSDAHIPSSIVNNLACQECGTKEKNAIIILSAVITLPDNKPVIMKIPSCKNKKCKEFNNQCMLEIMKNFNRECRKHTKIKSKYVMNCDYCEVEINKRQKCSVCLHGTYCSDECFHCDWKEHKIAFH
jgi:hypothetical protein